MKIFTGSPGDLNSAGGDERVGGGIQRLSEGDEGQLQSVWNLRYVVVVLRRCGTGKLGDQLTRGGATCL